MKGPLEGFKVIVHFPDGKVKEYRGDREDQILLAVSEEGSSTCQNVVSCTGQFFCHAITKFLESSVEEAKRIVAHFIAQDLKRMFAAKEKAEGGKELTLDALLGRGEDEPGGRFH